MLQIQRGVVFSTFEVRVDRMTVLRGNTTEQVALLAGAANGTQVVSVVAFRCICSLPLPATDHFESTKHMQRSEAAGELDRV